MLFSNVLICALKTKYKTAPIIAKQMYCRYGIFDIYRRLPSLSFRSVVRASARDIPKTQVRTLAVIIVFDVLQKYFN